MRERMDGNAFRGLAVALVTPFKADGSIDIPRFRNHVKFQIAGGVDALVPCGTTGESATLSGSEQRELIRTTVEVAASIPSSETPSGKRVLVIAGAGSNSTKVAAELAVGACEAGADAVLSVGPYYNKPTQEGFYRHYEAVAEAAEIPVIIYNVPGRTGSNIQPETVLRLAELSNVVGVKEASGDLSQVMTILRGRPEGFLVLAGDDEMALPVIALGGDGVISVASNEIPAGMSQLVHAALAGNLEEARKLHDLLLPLMRANFIVSNPIPVKSALEMMGRMEAHFRLPLTPLGEGEAREVLMKALQDVGMLQ